MIGGLDRLRETGSPILDWKLGGGTGLMIHIGHRFSKDIDAFIDDPQYLAFLSPRLGGENVWPCEAYEESANHLRLVFPEGEIDFIVAAAVTGLASERKSIETRPGLYRSVDLEHPVEIALKKLRYRGRLLKVRDVFDIATVDALFGSSLRENLGYVANMKSEIVARLDGISDAFLKAELAELDIADAFQAGATECLLRVRQMVESVL